MCVNFSPTSFFNIVRRIKGDTIKNVYLSPREVPVIVVTHEAKTNLKISQQIFGKKNNKK